MVIKLVKHYFFVVGLVLDYIDNYNLEGLIIGVSTFLIIGLFHPIVVKCEYYFGKRVWYLFLLCGIAGIVGSVFVESILLSTLLGVFAFSSLWSIKELFEQEKRVKKGWFPRNPKRKYDF